VYKFCQQQGVKITFGTEVTSVDTSNKNHVSIALANGQTEEADMVSYSATGKVMHSMKVQVIGADGYCSLVRSVVVDDQADEDIVAKISGQIFPSTLSTVRLTPF
jgi:2-polyprenyl-6-methoxyphenol hydroxylase-like FAD-dependent oxidoreductase